MIKLSSLLRELITKDLRTKDESEHQFVVVYRSHLFLVDGDSDLNPIKSVVKDHPQLQKDYYKEKLGEAEDVFEFMTFLAEAAPDIMVGEWYPENRGLVVWDQEGVVPHTSLNAKRAASALGAEHVTYRYFDYVHRDDSAEKDISVKKLTGEIPKVVYHGTATTELKSILTYGLDPGRGPSRFSDRGIEHPDHIFLGAAFEEALFYADNAVMKSRKEKKGRDVFPIVVELTVPDPSLLVPDYDADVSSTSEPYYKDKEYAPKTSTAMKAMGVSRETGKWGYKGRIPAKFIRWVYYYNTSEKKWHKSRPDVWRRLLDKYWDWETIAWRLGMYGYRDEDYKNTPYWRG